MAVKAAVAVSAQEQEPFKADEAEEKRSKDVAKAVAQNTQDAELATRINNVVREAYPIDEKLWEQSTLPDSLVKAVHNLDASTILVGKNKAKNYIMKKIMEGLIDSPRNAEGKEKLKADIKKAIKDQNLSIGPAKQNVIDALSKLLEKTGKQLFTSKKGDLTYMLERVSSKEDYEKWQSFHKDQVEHLILLYNISHYFSAEKSRQLKEFMRTLSAEELKQITESPLVKKAEKNAQLKEKLINMEKMLGQINEPQRQMMRLLEFYNKADVWVAYAKSTDIISKLTPATFKDVEISVMVVTDEGLPFQTHMGITRAPHYMQRVLSDEEKTHEAISWDLQGFIAEVMDQAYEKGSKKFMINSPNIFLRTVLQKKFGNLDSNSFQSTSTQMPSKGPIELKIYGGEESSKYDFILRDRENKIIFQAGPVEQKSLYPWLFHYDYFALIANDILRKEFLSK